MAHRVLNRLDMKIVIIGGTGLIGSKVTSKLRTLGHDAVAAAPNTGVNTLTGEGLREALAGADVVVDVSNSPSFDDAPVMRFFETSTRHLLAAELAAGVKNHVALSVVGTERLSESGYFRAKIVQEALIKASPIPYTIIHATQFFEFVHSIAAIATEGDEVHLPPVLIQPMAADDVASAVAAAAIAPAINGTLEIGGPEQIRMDQLIQRELRAHDDSRTVIVDPHARYYGIEVGERTLLPDAGAKLGTIKFADWLAKAA